MVLFDIVSVLLLNAVWRLDLRLQLYDTFLVYINCGSMRVGSCVKVWSELSFHMQSLQLFISDVSYSSFFPGRIL